MLGREGEHGGGRLQWAVEQGLFFAVFLSLFLVASAHCEWVSKAALGEILPSILSQKPQSGIASAILGERLGFLGLGSAVVVTVRIHG